LYIKERVEFSAPAIGFFAELQVAEFQPPRKWNPKKRIVSG
jgi:hypothetical protein